MTRNIHDSFAKEWMKELLGDFVQVKVERKVSGEVRTIDIVFFPDLTLSSDRPSVPMDPDTNLFRSTAKRILRCGETRLGRRHLFSSLSRSNRHRSHSPLTQNLGHPMVKIIRQRRSPAIGDQRITRASTDPSLSSGNLETSDHVANQLQGKAK